MKRRGRGREGGKRRRGSGGEGINRQRHRERAVSDYQTSLLAAELMETDSLCVSMLSAGEKQNFHFPGRSLWKLKG